MNLNSIIYHTRFAALFKLCERGGSDPSRPRRTSGMPAADESFSRDAQFNRDIQVWRCKAQPILENTTYRSVLLLLGYKVMGHGYDANLIALLCPPPQTLICMQLNVEYNQLDPLLQEATGEGDVNDTNTGFSPYPGNINQLVFALGPYSKVRLWIILFLDRYRRYMGVAGSRVVVWTIL